MPKCFVYLVVWLFDQEGRPRTATKEEVNIDFRLQQSDDGTVESIKQLNCNVAHRTLGVHINPLGDMKLEYTKQLQKGRDFAR